MPFTAQDPLPPTRTTGDSPTLGVAGDVNELGTAISELQNASLALFSEVDLKLTATALQTSAYVAKNGDLVLADPSAGSFTAQLPTAPADGTKIGIQNVSTTTGNPNGNAVAVAAGGTDVFYPGGTNADSVAGYGELKIYRYQAASTRWIVQDNPTRSDVQNMVKPQPMMLFEDNGTATLTKGPYNLSADGVPAPDTNGPSGIEFRAALPPNGATVGDLYQLVGSTKTVLGTVTVPANSASASVSIATPATVTKFAPYMAEITSSSGSFAGQGWSVWSTFGTDAIPALPTAPGVPTGLSVTKDSNGCLLTWTAVSGANAYVVIKNGAAFDIVYSPTVQYRDTTGLATDQYALQSRLPRIVSAACSAVTAPTAYTYFSQTDGAPSGFSTVLGTSTNGAPAVAVASDVLTLTSATSTTGNNAVSDRVGVKWTADGKTHKYFSISGQYAPVNSNTIFDIFLSAGALDNTFTYGANFVEFEFSPTQGRVGYKAPTYTPPSSTAGSFYSPNGYINWGTNGTSTINATGTNWYGFKVDIVNNGDGTAGAHLYQGTTTQLTANTLPLLTSMTLDATMLPDLSAGYFEIVQLGNTGAGSGIFGSTHFQSLSVTAS